jgi:hypothetical protein
MLNIEMAQRVGIAELEQVLEQVALHYNVKIINNGHGKIKIYNSRRAVILSISELTGMAYSALRIKLAGAIKACGFERNSYNGSLLAKLSPKLKGISAPVMDLASVTITADSGYSA